MNSTNDKLNELIDTLLALKVTDEEAISETLISDKKIFDAVKEIASSKEYNFDNKPINTFVDAYNQIIEDEKEIYNDTITDANLSDSENLYFKDIIRIPLLTKEEEYEIA